MAVTLKQIRAKREEVRILKEKYDSAYEEYSAACAVKKAKDAEQEKAREEHRYAFENLKEMGRQFALDEGEDAIQEKLDLPEQTEITDDDIPF
jgi:hypothetical protein